jgi:hypothetical protein
MRRQPAHPLTVLLVAVTFAARAAISASGLIAHTHAEGGRVHVHAEEWTLGHSHDDDDGDHRHGDPDHAAHGIHASSSDQLHWHAFHAVTLEAPSPASVTRPERLHATARQPAGAEPAARGHCPAQPRAPPLLTPLS